MRECKKNSECFVFQIPDKPAGKMTTLPAGETTDAKTQTRRRKKSKTSSKNVKPAKKYEECPRVDSVKNEEDIESEVEVVNNEPYERKSVNKSFMRLENTEPLHDLYFKDDNFIILNPNFKISNETLTSGVIYCGSAPDQQTSYELLQNKLEKVLKKKCKYRAMGYEKCNCKLCNTIGVLKDSLKHSGPFDWEFPKPSMTKVVRGKYVTSGPFICPISNSNNLSISQKELESVDVESIMYLRLEEKLNRLKRKLSEMNNDDFQSSKETFIAPESTFNCNPNSKTLTIRNIKFLAEGTMNIIGKPKTKEQDRYQSCPSSMLFSN